MELKRNVSSGLLWFAACFATVHFVRLFLKSCIDFTFFNFEPYLGAKNEQPLILVRIRSDSAACCYSKVGKDQNSFKIKQGRPVFPISITILLFFYQFLRFKKELFTCYYLVLKRGWFLEDSKDFNIFQTAKQGLKLLESSDLYFQKFK